MSSADPHGLTTQARANREFWNRDADEYQARNREFIGRPEPRWGMWQIPESELQILGDVTGKDVLELGCGAAQWSILLAQQGARMTAVDNSDRQLEHARRAVDEAGVDVELVHASAESRPFEDGSFDVVVCDHGAMTFADPYLVVPEVARVLRAGGLFAFSHVTPFEWLCYVEQTDSVGELLTRDLFGMHRWDTPGGSVEFQLPAGEWIRLFRANGFTIEDLREIQPAEGAFSTYRNEEETAWARRWPMEEIWNVRRS
jgi:SAM-dependent methyltransferase